MKATTTIPSEENLPGGQCYTLEDFETGERRQVIAANWWEALESSSQAAFTVVKSSGGSYEAITLKNDVFAIPGAVVSATPQDAAEGLRERYAAVKEHFPRHSS